MNNPSISMPTLVAHIHQKSKSQKYFSTIICSIHTFVSPLSPILTFTHSYIQYNTNTNVVLGVNPLEFRGHTFTHYYQFTHYPTQLPFTHPNPPFYSLHPTSFHPSHSTHLIPPTSFHPPHSTHLIPPTSFHPPHSTHLIPPTSFHPPHSTHLIPPTSLSGSANSMWRRDIALTMATND